MSPPNAAGWAPAQTLWARRIKRPVDAALALAGIVLSAPLLALAALAVKLESPGPLLFRQVRTGRGGRPFTPFKLRTMRADHRHDPTEIVPLSHPGITRLGRLLRRLKLDELPQLGNVLRGEMSLVGPRPTLPEQTETYDAFERRRLAVRPGLTGLAQVHGGAAISWEERIRYDVHYAERVDLRMDLAILLRTLPLLVLGEARFARPFAESRYRRRLRKQPSAS